jgi:hypothetical protein
MRAGLSPMPRIAFEPDVLEPRQANRWIAGLIVLGIAIRLVRFALRFPLWYDEAALSANFLDRGYLDFMRPLECGQAAPILFLWVQTTLVRLLGFTEYSLRLFPLATGIASLFVFRRLASRLLEGSALVLAVGILAVSYPAIRYAAEGKPYGSDLFVSLVLLALAVEWMSRPERTHLLWGLAAVVPWGIGLSFPAAFIGGGVSLATGWVLWRTGTRRGWAPWAAYNLLLMVSFVAVMAVARSNLSEAAAQVMERYWQNAFPPLDSPAALGRWLVATHTGDALAHPFGGDRGASTLTSLLCVVALGVLVRSRQGVLLLLLLAPAALNFIAAAMHRYPYGGHIRLAMHLAPSVCLLAGMGAQAALERGFRGRPRRTATLVVFGLLTALGIGSMVRDIAWPARSENDQRARGFARWFWTAKAFDAELVCVKTDLRLPLARSICLEGDEAIYLCNQRIYSPRHARQEPARLDRVSSERPLRCAWFRVPWLPVDEAAVAQWLAEMQANYRLVARETFPLPVFSKRGIESLNTLELFEFVPRGDGSQAAKADDTSLSTDDPSDDPSDYTSTGTGPRWFTETGGAISLPTASATLRHSDIVSSNCRKSSDW